MSAALGFVERKERCTINSAQGSSTKTVINEQVGPSQGAAVTAVHSESLFSYSFDSHTDERHKNTVVALKLVCIKSWENHDSP